MLSSLNLLSKNEYLIRIIISFISSWCFINNALPFLKKYFPDKPNKRSSHSVIKARAGGVSFVLIPFLFSLFDHDPEILICSAFAMVSLIDDKFNISSIFRYISQILVVIVLLVNSILYKNFLISFIDLNLFFFIFLIVFLTFSGTAIINFVNFMDGIDGLVSGSMLVILITSFYLLELNWLISLIASLLAFFIWNWYPSKLFMGDVGSTFLGAIFVTVIFSNVEFKTNLGLLLVSFPIIFDAFFCVLRRYINKQNIFEAHKSHLYQRLSQAGFKHSTVSTIYISSSILISLSLCFGGLLISFFTCIVIFILGWYLDKNVALPFRMHLS
ncbi:hypothetical protein B0W81_05255 [Prochlorococcus sp. HOT_208_60]|nr:hypothetical protein B0W81_05255 [Prochlorococcus sp. HOT_208_60]